MRVAARGFHTAVAESFDLTVNARQRVDLTMQVGEASQSITVSDAAELLETETSSKGQVITPKQIVDLPLNGRSYADLADLVPGVARSPLENQTDSSRDGSFNVNGVRSEYNNFMLDGVDNNAYGTSNQGFSNQVIQPNPDALSAVQSGNQQLQRRVRARVRRRSQCLHQERRQPVSRRDLGVHAQHHV